jgi:hypothetical protein
LGNFFFWCAGELGNRWMEDGDGWRGVI